MKPNHHKIISECVDNGIRYGIMRAHKYNENPSDEDIAEKVFDAVMNEICEYYDFEPLSYDEAY